MNQHDQSSYEFTETETAGTGPAWVCSRYSAYTLWLHFSIFMGFLSIQASS